MVLQGKQNDHKKGVCPICQKDGVWVSNQTVRCMVKKEAIDRVGYYGFFLCSGPSCRVGYFNNEIKQIVTTDHLLKPIWFKVGVNPLYACYCRSITKEEVLRTVLETNLDDRYSIILYLRGEGDSRCKVSNPAGRCCDRDFIRMIDEALKIKKILLRYENYNLNSIQVNKKALERYSTGVSVNDNTTRNRTFKENALKIKERNLF